MDSGRQQRTTQQHEGVWFNPGFKSQNKRNLSVETYWHDKMILFIYEYTSTDINHELHSKNAPIKYAYAFVFPAVFSIYQHLWIDSWDICPHHDDVIKRKHFPCLLVICAGNSPITGEFPTQRLVTRSFVVFFDLRLHKWLRKQSWGWWFETPSRPLWRHRHHHHHHHHHNHHSDVRFHTTLSFCVNKWIEIAVNYV